MPAAVFLDRSMPTAEALPTRRVLAGLLEDAHRSAPLDLVAGPSGYGLPLIDARRLTDNDLRLAYLAAEGERGGIGGLPSLMRELARLPIPIVLTPGVVHLPTVPAHRKVNRVDMGTADKVCVAALALREHAHRHGCEERDASFILLELGGAFTAALAVEHGAIVDGVGGSSGPIGGRAAGALDGELAFLAGTVTKRLLFSGGAASIAGTPDASAENWRRLARIAGRLAWEAYLESAVKAVVSLAVSAPARARSVLSGRFARIASVREELTRRLSAVAAPPLQLLAGFAATALQAAQGAALLADGLAGGTSKPLVDALGIREASGTVLDHLYVITPAAARARLGLA